MAIGGGTNEVNDDVSPGCARTYARLCRQLERTVELAAQPDGLLTDRWPDVSAWTAAQHLDHIASANRACVDTIEEILAGGSRTGSGPTLVGRAVLATGWIPRGVGKAPVITLPGERALEEIRRELRAVKERVLELEPRMAEIDRSAGRAAHHVFGGLRPRDWLRTMEVHTHHHIKIIRDILSAAEANVAVAGIPPHRDGG